MIQVPWFGDTPRSPAIAGIDTLAIDVSSTFMKVASPTASEAARRAPPSSGGWASCGLAAGACAMRGCRRRRQSRTERAVGGDDLLDARVGLRIARGERGRGVGRRLTLDALQAPRGAVVRIDIDLHR